MGTLSAEGWNQVFRRSPSQSQGVRWLPSVHAPCRLQFSVVSQRVQIWFDKKLHHGTEVVHTRGCKRIDSPGSKRSDGVRGGL